MIEIEGLTKVFKTIIGPPFTAVDHIDLHVKKRDIFGFLGPNGAGKTTTIKMLTTILHPTSGTAKIMGYDVVKEPNQVKRHIGFMPEKPGFYEDMNPEELLSFYGEFYKLSRSETKQRSRELLQMTGIYEFRKRKVKAFSHGMRKRVALCQALMHDPELLILDEPTGGLDPAGTHEFRELLKQLRKEGKTILLSSHLLSEVQMICNRVGIIYRGRMVDQGSLKEIRKKAASETPYITIKGRGFTDSVLEDVAEVEGILYIRPKKTKSGETLLLYLDGKGPNSNRVSEDVVSSLVGSGAKVNSVLPPEMDLEGAFLNLIRGSKGGKK